MADEQKIEVRMRWIIRIPRLHFGIWTQAVGRHRTVYFNLPNRMYEWRIR